MDYNDNIVSAVNNPGEKKIHVITLHINDSITIKIANLNYYSI